MKVLEVELIEEAPELYDLLLLVAVNRAKPDWD
jgi:hypothetical protein